MYPAGPSIGGCKSTLSCCQLMRYWPKFLRVIPHRWAGYLRVTHPCATVLTPKCFLVRLACIKHAASVRSEPGSNSPSKLILAIVKQLTLKWSRRSSAPTDVGPMFRLYRALQNKGQCLLYVEKSSIPTQRIPSHLFSPLFLRRAAKSQTPIQLSKSVKEC